MADGAAPTSPTEGAREDVALALGGTRFGGWTSIDIQIDLEAGASSFSLGVTKKDPIRTEDWRIEADAACEVTIGGETVITGYTDRIESDLGAASHTITVSGRSKSADLIDCSAIAQPGSWRGRRIEQIAAELAKPFGIHVVAETDTGGPLRLFALQPGETVWEAIARACQHRGLLPITRADGTIALINAKPTGSAVRLSQGDNLLTVRGSHDVSERFSRYVVKGQSAGDDDVNGKAAAHAKAEAGDPAVRRHRPMMIVAEEQADTASLKRRAAWEAIVRAARAQSADVTLIGWRRSDGSLWDVAQAVDLDAPAAWISDAMMVSGVRFVLDEQGRRIELHIVRPEAYSQLPVPEEAESSKIKKKSRKSKKELAADDAKKAVKP
ncbi:MAG: phage baseplate assembly protein [Sphingomicrobium sp.]